MDKPVACSHCGAMTEPTPDGRQYVCRYCGTRMQVGIDAQQLAQGFALDLTNVDAFMSRLANVLSQGFSEHTRIDAQARYVQAIEINLEPSVFSIRREGQHAVGQHKKVVRGIALKTQTLPLDRWLQMLLEALAAHANANARAAWVLGQLGGQKP